MKFMLRNMKRDIFDYRHNIELDSFDKSSHSWDNEYEHKKYSILIRRIDNWYSYIDNKVFFKLFKKDNYTEEFLELNIIQKVLCVGYIILAQIFPSYILSGVYGECDYNEKEWFPVLYMKEEHTGQDYYNYVLCLRNLTYERNLQ